MNDLKLHKLLTGIAVLVAIGSAASTSVLYAKVQKLEEKPQAQVLSTPEPLVAFPSVTPSTTPTAQPTYGPAVSSPKATVKPQVK